MLRKRKLHVFDLLINSEDAPTPRVILLSVTSKESEIKLLFEQFLMIFPKHRHLRGVSERTSCSSNLDEAVDGRPSWWEGPSTNTCTRGTEVDAAAMEGAATSSGTDGMLHGRTQDGKWDSNPGHQGNTVSKCRGSKEGGSSAMDAGVSILKVGGIETAMRFFL
ncbi:hypothetical protein D8674_033964 [Pyrus ussuriensis x Pyrus communis]|uniref:Uncharacterized protein n=1 Tax=Pyrus ussuriensis x Pyrus communis TaxID=2448454 RepID=A0A5N5HMK2_9ROSA|nr:hypothetical protein D8674_033964 [Pyrus ussuriensis x Pyrus communis]